MEYYGKIKRVNTLIHPGAILGGKHLRFATLSVVHHIYRSWVTN